MDNTSAKPWQEIAKQAKAYRDETIEEVPDIPEDLPRDVTKIPNTLLSDDDIAITETVPERLIERIAGGHLTCVAVISAFLRRASIAQKLVFNPYARSEKIELTSPGQLCHGTDGRKSDCEG